MRERLIKTIFDYWEGNHPGADWDDAEWDHGKLSDAILAALPSMVPDLSWKSRRNQHWSRGGVHKYGFWKQHTGRWYVVGSDETEILGTKKECVEWANRHNVKSIMAAFGIEVKT